VSGLVARLDKQGKHVVCGMRDCGTRLANFVCAPMGFVIPDAAFTDSGRRFIRAVFEDGWVDRGDGVWHLSNRSERIQRERASAANQSREALARNAWRRRTPRRLDGKPVHAHHGSSVPREAICPSCGQRQLVDPLELAKPFTLPSDGTGAEESGSTVFRRLSSTDEVGKD
jgi:hypothetical protein